MFGEILIARRPRDKITGRIDKYVPPRISLRHLSVSFEKQDRQLTTLSTLLLSTYRQMPENLISHPLNQGNRLALGLVYNNPSVRQLSS